jgi:hypothetical protein
MKDCQTDSSARGITLDMYLAEPDPTQSTPEARTAMVMLAENYEYVIGGDPDRDTIDLAVLDTATGRVRAHLAGVADGAGYRQMLAWAGENAPGRLALLKASFCRNLCAVLLVGVGDVLYCALPVFGVGTRDKPATARAGYAHLAAWPGRRRAS